MVQWPKWTRFQGTEADTPKDTTDDSTSGTSSLTQFDTLPIPLLALTAFAVGSATTLTGAFIYTRYCRRLKNSDWVTPNVLRKRRWIKGVVTSVGDADNFRLYHTPPLGGWHWPLKIRKIPSLRKDLRNETIHIRIAGVDAPEAGHFGKPAQPFAAESLMWLKGRILGKVVYCQLLRRDQYSRIVAYVQMSPKVLPGLIGSGKSLPLEMLKAGWVTTYEQAGAEYGKYGRDAYLCAEAEAKAARRGMWKHGTQLETPAEYKRRQAQRLIEGNAETIMTKGDATTTTNVTWWNRLQKLLWSRIQK